MIIERKTTKNKLSFSDRTSVVRLLKTKTYLFRMSSLTDLFNDSVRAWIISAQECAGQPRVGQPDPHHNTGNLIIEGNLTFLSLCHLYKGYILYMLFKNNILPAPKYDILINLSYELKRHIR